jgi:hypothetical protein
VFLHTKHIVGKTTEIFWIQIQTQVNQLLITNQTKLMTTWFLVLKKKHQKFIVENDSDEDDQLVQMRTDDIIDGLINKSAKHKALENVLATGELLSQRIKNIDRIISQGKTKDQEMDEKCELKIKDKIKTGTSHKIMKKKYEQLDEKVQTIFYTPTFLIFFIYIDCF